MYQFVLKFCHKNLHCLLWPSLCLSECFVPAQYHQVPTSKKYMCVTQVVNMAIYSQMVSEFALINKLYIEQKITKLPTVKHNSSQHIRQMKHLLYIRFCFFFYAIGNFPKLSYSIRYLMVFKCNNNLTVCIWKSDFCDTNSLTLPLYVNALAFPSIFYNLLLIGAKSKLKSKLKNIVLILILVITSSIPIAALFHSATVTRCRC